jgi:hypothetical protein
MLPRTVGLQVGRYARGAHRVITDMRFDAADFVCPALDHPVGIGFRRIPCSVSITASLPARWEWPSRFD